ncbi:alkaline phosphatase D family protein [Nonomuraea glycinis]|uniref:alkaline phosphatase D family protein n=1 Tax=Nonomuraea glycinis TaxID=2047744 RepID=UPI0033B0D83D
MSSPLGRTLSRRGLLGGAGATAVLLGTSALGDPAGATPPQRHGLPDDPFKLGVASGDPLPNSVVLWTRLAPDPLAADGSGGMPPRRVPVQWQVAEDEGFRRIVKRGTAVAGPELNHSVHPEVWGLRPGRHYFYRFKVGTDISPVGRTKTAPSHDAHVSSVSLGVASCALWQHGFYTAYGRMAEDDLDVVLQVGDYIYENGVPADGGTRQTPVPDYLSPETVTLERYRLQYSLYKSDADLMAAHAAHPWAVTLDDHEVDNDWADDVPQNAAETPGFLDRRAAAFQAYYENLPLRASALPDGPDMQLYRRLAYGDLLDINVLDTRQYRDDQAAGGGLAAPNPGSLDPNRTMMGREQEQWLLDNFERSRVRWQVLANQAPMAETDMDDTEAVSVFMDPWDGYDANRRRMLDGARDRGVDNLVVLTGDRHRHHASDIKADYRDPAAPVLASEFVCTSVTAEGNGADMDSYSELSVRANPHIKFANYRRGYLRCTVTEDLWSTDFRVLPYVDRPGAPASTRATYVVENGRPGVQLASEGPIV